MPSPRDILPHEWWGTYYTKAYSWSGSGNRQGFTRYGIPFDSVGGGWSGSALDSELIGRESSNRRRYVSKSAGGIWRGFAAHWTA